MVDRNGRDSLLNGLDAYFRRTLLAGRLVDDFAVPLLDSKDRGLRGIARLIVGSLSEVDDYLFGGDGPGELSDEDKGMVNLLRSDDESDWR
jgi:hypothetical protein